MDGGWREVGGNRIQMHRTVQVGQAAVNNHVMNHMVNGIGWKQRMTEVVFSPWYVYAPTGKSCLEISLYIITTFCDCEWRCFATLARTAKTTAWVPAGGSNDSIMMMIMSPS